MYVINYVYNYSAAHFDNHAEYQISASDLLF